MGGREDRKEGRKWNNEMREGQRQEVKLMYILKHWMQKLKKKWTEQNTHKKTFNAVCMRKI